MEIKVVQEGECTSVTVVNPATEECASATHLVSGQSVTLTLPDVHDASGIQVAEPEPVASEPSDEAAPEPGQEPDGGTPGEEPQAGEPEPGEPEAGGGEPPAEGDQGGGEPTPEPGQ